MAEKSSEKKAELSYEKAVERLETIVRDLEGGKAP